MNPSASLSPHLRVRFPPFGLRRLELCPVRALASWLERASITEGPLFRGIDRHGRLSAAALNHRSVALIVQRAAGCARC